MGVCAFTMLFRIPNRGIFKQTIFCRLPKTRDIGKCVGGKNKVQLIKVQGRGSRNLSLLFVFRISSPRYFVKEIFSVLSGSRDNGIPMEYLGGAKCGAAHEGVQVGSGRLVFYSVHQA